VVRGRTGGGSIPTLRRDRLVAPAVNAQRKQAINAYSGKAIEVGLGSRSMNLGSVQHPSEQKRKWENSSTTLSKMSAVGIGGQKDELHHPLAAGRN